MINGAMTFSIATFNITVMKKKSFVTLIPERIPQRANTTLKVLYSQKGVIYSCLELLAYFKFWIILHEYLLLLLLAGTA
jgi:hypothetical protein